MAYRSSTSSNGVSTTPSTTVPASVATDDIVILVVNADSPTATISWPANFTQLTSQINTDQTTAAAWKRLTGADAGSYTMGSLGSSIDWVLIAAAFSGRDTTNPPVVGTATNNTSLNASPVTVTAPAVTAVVGDDMVYIGGLDVTAAGIANVWTGPTNYTSRQSPESSGGWADCNVSTRDNVASGTTGTVSGSVTLTSGSTRWTSYQIRIPQSTGSGGTTAHNFMTMGVGQ